MGLGFRRVSVRTWSYVHTGDSQALLYVHRVEDCSLVYGQTYGHMHGHMPFVRTLDVRTAVMYGPYTMYRKERLELRLSDKDLAVLDQRRGATTRSAYIRWLIHQDRPVNPVESSLSEPNPVSPPSDPVQPIPPDEPFDPPIPKPIVPPVNPGAPVETGAKRHLHRFKKAENPINHIKGVPQYRQVCAGCGMEKVGP